MLGLSMYTCFQDSVGTPISSMLGLAQLARALPRLGTTIRREVDSSALVADIVLSSLKYNPWGEWL